MYEIPTWMVIGTYYIILFDGDKAKKIASLTPITVAGIL